MASKVPSVPALLDQAAIAQPGAVSASVEGSLPIPTDPDGPLSISQEWRSVDEQTQRTRDEFLAVARRRYQTIESAESELRRNQKTDLEFFASDQWPEDIKRQRVLDHRPCLTINRLPGFVRQLTNEMRDGRPGIEIIPVDNGADPALAEVLQGIIQHIEANSNADIAYSRAAEAQVRVGRGWFRIRPEWAADNGFEQELTIDSIRNPNAVYADPAMESLDGSDMRYCFLVQDVPNDEYDARFGPETRGSLESFARTPTSAHAWFPTGKTRVAEYYYLEPVKRTIGQLANGEVVNVEDLQKPEVQARLTELGIPTTPVRTREVERPQLSWALLNGMTILDGNDDRTAGRPIPGSSIPVIPVYGEEIDIEGKVDYRGIIRDAIGAQQMSNFWKSAKTETVALAPKSPFVAEAGQIEGFEDEWNTANTRNYSVLRYRGKALDGHLIGPPQRNTAEPPIQAMSLLSLEAENDLRATAGFSYDVGAQEKRLEQSGRAILARQKQGEMGNSHFAAHLSVSLRHAGRILLELIPIYYSGPRIQRILGRDGQQREVLVHAGNTETAAALAQAQHLAEEQIYDLSRGRYDVRVTAGVSFASQRQQDQDTMSQIMQANPQMSSLLADLMFGTMNSPIAKRAAVRMHKALPPPLQDDADQPKPAIPPELQKQMQDAQFLIDTLTQQLEEKTDQLGSKYEELASKERIAQIQASATIAVAESKLATEQSLALLDARLRGIEQLVALDLARLKAAQESSTSPSPSGDATTPPQGALPPPSAVPGVGGPPESLGEMPPMTGGM